MKRAVITGMGLITPLGIGAEATWDGLVAGRSGIRPISLLSASSFRCRQAGEVLGFDPGPFGLRPRTIRMMTRGDQLAFAAATLALRDAGIEPDGLDGERTGLYVGGNKEVCRESVLMEAAVSARNPDGTVDEDRFGEMGQSSIYPLFFVQGLPAASLFYISEAYGLKGPNGFFVGTGDAGVMAVGSAFRAIRRGEAEVAVAGSFDDAVSWWNLSKLEALEVLSCRNDLGPAAYRPYDRERSGSLLGEGAAFLVLEEYGRARERGARIYAEVTGFGSSYDAYRLVTPHPEGRGLALAMQGALREAKRSPGDVDCLVTHGSGTLLGDASEVTAIRHLFGLGADRLRATCIKPATGNLAGGAGALNVAVAALAVHHQLLPPTLHLVEPDPHCRLGWVTGESQPVAVQEALALARGLEGQNGAIALRRVEG